MRPPVRLLFVALLAPLVVGAARAEERPGAPGGPVKLNRLAEERSPYLRQHRTNPVDWYPWGEEALARARAEDRPIFLSVGYAACHWCHVMEHESFEDEATAALLNEVFVCVKVDREERPDIDALYMRAVHVTTGRGGWPMTVLLTPEGDPFFAGTYFPRPQLQQIVRRVDGLWKNERSKLREQAQMVSDRVRDLADGQDLPGYEGTDEELLHIVETALQSHFDGRHGGYGGAPKFPPHAELLFLLDRAQEDERAQGLEQVRRTLEAMDEGGVHDHVGGGFHRYSTDAVWMVPHFEKMLYDNALLAQAYAGFYEITGEARFAEVAHGILGWVERELLQPKGGYASSLDADTEGEEGLTYTWTLDEVRAVLAGDGVLAGDEDATFVVERFGLRTGGNFRDEASRRPTGRNIFHLPRPLPAAERVRAANLCERLREARDQRPQPGLDDKVITAWNGLLLSAFARCGASLSDERYLDRGRALADYLLAACRRDDGVLLRFPRGSGTDIVGFCEDHVHLAEGLLDLAEATGEAKYAQAARALGDHLLAHFADEQQGGFWSTSKTWHEPLLARQKETYDSPIPSENGTAARVLLRLAARFGEPHYRKAAERTLDAWRPLLGMARAATGTVALYRALADYVRFPSDESAAEAAALPPADVIARTGRLRADLYLERQQVRAGSEVRVALHVAVREGWHVNADAVADADLVPTLLRTATAATATAAAGAVGPAVALEGVAFPAPTRRSLGPGQEPVALFEGTFWVRGVLAIPADAAAGALDAALVLSFQPCSDTECLAPREMRLDLEVEVAEEDGALRHPSVFG